MAVVDVDGTRLAYTDAGRGEPLVFVHGSLEDCASGGARSSCSPRTTA